ncbi:hypothetical protein Sm713_59650 [Streptomyces sp. TS71-3]|nr:hypothetical protein Sm713_59650 [Streptomyces sp. TS71-3]
MAGRAHAAEPHIKHSPAPLSGRDFTGTQGALKGRGERREQPGRKSQITIGRKGQPLMRGAGNCAKNHDETRASPPAERGSPVRRRPPAGGPERGGPGEG